MPATWTKTGALRSMRAVQALTESAPTTSQTDGVDISDVLSILPVFTASSAFTGTGSLLGYILPNGASSWVRAPSADLDASDLSGLTVGALPSVQVGSPAGRFMWVPSGVTLSGAGSTVTTDYYCVTRTGAAA